MLSSKRAIWAALAALQRIPRGLHAGTLDQKPYMQRSCVGSSSSSIGGGGGGRRRRQQQLTCGMSRSVSSPSLSIVLICDTSGTLQLRATLQKRGLQAVQQPPRRRAGVQARGRAGFSRGRVCVHTRR